jgi:hypothetical protein
MSNASTPALARTSRPVVTAPTLGTTRGTSLSLQIPVWIASVVIHAAIGGLFVAILMLSGLFGKIRANNVEVPRTSEQVTKIEEKEPDLTNTDTGTDSELPTQFNVERIEDVSVPGPVNATEAIGILNAPEAPARTLSAPPGSGGGTGLALPSGEPGTGSMIGTPGGYASGIFNAGGFGGRSGATREKLLQEGGGNAASEAAVARGLEWLAMHQSSDGRWSMTEFHLHGHDANGKPIPGNCGCQGPGGGSATDIAGTAFGLLPFLAGGQTHKPSSDPKRKDYSKVVNAGLHFLMRKQGKDGDFGGGMYSHGLATIAMCEAYGLTNDPMLRVSAQRAINYIVEAQDPKGGGWRYAPKSSGDMSVSGWELMALKSGQMSGLSVPKRTMEKAEEFWRDSEVRAAAADVGEGSSLAKKKGKLKGFSYTPGTKTEKITMTAVGLLGMQYMGTTPASRDLLDGVEELKKYPPGRTGNCYYEYYATQVMHHMGGESWQFWNLGPDGKSGIRDTLIAKQDKGLDAKHVHQLGSWDGAGAQGGGRIMATSLNLLSLEVYYRHLPLYRRELATVKEEK